MYGRLPQSAQEIADVIGVERTLYLIGKLPKIRSGQPGKESTRVVLYVPKRLPIDHMLVRILGWKDAEKLSIHFPGEILSPALCNEVYRAWRDRAICNLLKSGLSTTIVAQWFDLSTKQVVRVARAGKVGHV